MKTFKIVVSGNSLDELIQNINKAKEKIEKGYSESYHFDLPEIYSFTSNGTYNCSYKDNRSKL